MSPPVSLLGSHMSFLFHTARLLDSDLTHSDSCVLSGVDQRYLDSYHILAYDVTFVITN